MQKIPTGELGSYNNDIGPEARGLNGPARIYETGQIKYAATHLEASLHRSYSADSDPNGLNPPEQH